MVRSTSVSGLIQWEMGPPTSNSGSQIRPITWMFTSGHVFIDLGWADCSLPPLWSLLLLVPSFKSIVVWAVSSKMARQPTHKTLLLFSLEVAHHLSQAHTEAIHRFYLGLRVLPGDRVSRRQPLLLQGCHFAHQHGVTPVLFSINIGAGSVLACTCWLPSFQLFGESVQCVKGGVGLLLSGSSTIAKLRVSCR